MEHDVAVPVVGGPPVVVRGGEVDLSFTRTGGPGGQHANTSDTTVVLRFDVAGSASLTESQRRRALGRLGGRLTAHGELLLSGAEHRSQTRNREAVLARFAALMGEALAPPPPPRRPTRPSRAAREARLDDKRRRAERKALRRPPESG